jgi:hypothetical protein
LTRTARTLIIVALLAAGFLFVIAYSLLRIRGFGNSASDESAKQWGLVPTFAVNWSSPELPTNRPEASTIDTGVEHFDSDEVTPSPQLPALARPTTDVVCRIGPSTLYPPYTFLSTDQTLLVDGRSQENTWWRLSLSDDTSCWVWGELLDMTGDINTVPQLQPPPLPTATERPEIPPGTTAGCWVIDQQHPNGYCRPASCTPNDFPGTVCTLP